MRALLCLFALLVLGASPPRLPKYDYTQEPDPRNKELILGVGDTISVNVWENRDRV